LAHRGALAGGACLSAGVEVAEFFLGREQLIGFGDDRVNLGQIGRFRAAATERSVEQAGALGVLPGGTVGWAPAGGVLIGASDGGFDVAGDFSGLAQVAPHHRIDGDVSVGLGLGDAVVSGAGGFRAKLPPGDRSL
jgi:hypothetical protein